MATRISDAEKPLAPDAPRWAPGEGMTISTVRVVQTCDAYVAVEHPSDMTPEDLSAALTNRKGDVVAACSWWEAGKTSDVTEVVIGRNDPDNTYAEPITIGASDAEDPEPVAVVEEFSEEA